jgi:hypothetical protein
MEKKNKKVTINEKPKIHYIPYDVKKKIYQIIIEECVKSFIYKNGAHIPYSEMRIRYG